MARVFTAASLNCLELTSAVLTAAPLTMACWFNLTDSSANRGLMALEAAASNDHRFAIIAEGTNILQASTRSTVEGSAFASGTFTDNTWTHACAVFAASNSRTMYRDGANSGSNATDVTPTAGSITRTRLGRYAGFSNLTITGRACEFAIWNVALTAGEVAALASGVSPLRIRPQSLVCYVPAWGASDPEPDLVAARTFSLVNSPTQGDHVRVTAPVSGAWAIPWATTAVPQKARPSADTTRDNWEEDDGTTTNIFDQIDEASADDTDYIRTGLTPTNDVYVTKLTALTDPQTSTGHIVRYKYGKDGAGGDQIDITVQLRQGYVNEGTPGTLIKEFIHTDIPSGWTLATQTLSGAEADSITDYQNLYIRIIANKP